MNEELLYPVADPSAELFAELRRRRFHSGLYHRFTVPKATGGVRVILAPNPDLMRLLRGLLSYLIRLGLPGSQHAHAYYVDRSIRSMAEPHLGRRVVVKLDLADFFPSIGPHMVNGELVRHGVDAETRRLVLEWCFYPYPHGAGLPIGAPTSPLLSNLVAGARLDRRLAGLVRGWRRTLGPHSSGWRMEDVAYTRYADDLVVSSDYPQLGQIIPALRRVIEDAGFRVNEKKVRIMRRTGRQTVCGVVVNSAYGAPRPNRRALRHELYRLACDVAQRRCPPGHRIDRLTADGLPVVSAIDFPQLAGRISHVRWLKPNHAADLQRLLDRLIDLHRLPSEQHPDTVAWRRRQETACSNT